MKVAGLNKGYSQYSNLINSARNTINTNYNQAIAPFQTLFNNAQTGATTYADATGVNGAVGYDRAKANFQTNPGYQFQFDQGLQALDRGAASRGMVTSGNLLQAEQQYGTNLANQSYNQYVQNLLPYLNQSTQAATGLSGTYQNLGNQMATLYGNQANTAYQTQAGVGNANAAAEMNKYNVGSNIFGALMGGANLLSGGLGSMGGLFSGFGGSKGVVG